MRAKTVLTLQGLRQQVRAHRSLADRGGQDLGLTGGFQGRGMDGVRDGPNSSGPPLVGLEASLLQGTIKRGSNQVLGETTGVARVPGTREPSQLSSAGAQHRIPSLGCAGPMKQSPEGTKFVKLY